MPERLCRFCNTPIPAGRLEVLPDTDTCVEHSTVKSPIGFMVPTASKGCAPVLMVVPQNREAERQARNANKRKR